MSEATRDETAAAEQRAIDAALAIVERDGPLSGHPAYRSAWRQQAAREQIDNGIDAR